tara:strand:- start:390 stop:1040 length:651 start_codon:yes stop_codon:yes gene_type:complete
MKSFFDRMREFALAASLIVYTQGIDRDEFLEEEQNAKPSSDLMVGGDILHVEVGDVPETSDETKPVIVKTVDVQAEGKPLLNLQIIDTENQAGKRSCSSLSYAFQSEGCKMDHVVASTPSYQWGYNHDSSQKQSNIQAFKCGETDFSSSKGGTATSSSEAWRCLGNVGAGGSNWRIGVSAAVKQDFEDIRSAGRLGVCPEGDASCIGTTLHLQIDF